MYKQLNHKKGTEVISKFNDVKIVPYHSKQPVLTTQPALMVGTTLSAIWVATTQPALIPSSLP